MSDASPHADALKTPEMLEGGHVLTREEWRRVEEAFQKRESGKRLSDEEVGLIASAWAQDRDRARRLGMKALRRIVEK